MKAKNILMTLLLVTGAIAAKASGYPPELALVSQPVMVYNSNSITVYYDVENIGDHTYRGNVYLYLDPDNGYSYADEYVKVRPGHIKRIEIDIPLRRIDRRHTFTIMPYYELGDELYSFTTFEYFEPIRFFWDGPRTERWVVINVPPRISVYHRPGTYRYYYDGFRPPMPPPGHNHGTTPPPMDPHHHTYSYHHDNGGYPANHHHNGNTPPPAPNNDNHLHGDTPAPAPSNNPEAPQATVRPKPNAGSMSSGSHNSGNNNPPAPNNGSVSSRPKVNKEGSMSGRTGHSNAGSNGRSSVNSSSSTSSSSSRRSGSSSVRSSSSSSSSSSSRSGSSSGRR